LQFPEKQAQVCEQQYSGCSNSHGKPTATHPAQIVDVEIGVTIVVYIHCQCLLRWFSWVEGLTATTGAAVVTIVVVAFGFRLKQLHAEEISPAAYAFNAGGAPLTPSSGTALRLGAGATLGQLESVTWVCIAGAVVVLSKVSDHVELERIPTHAYCVGVTVARTVLVAGTLRYELQKDVAGAPRALIAPMTPVTALQFTARATKTSLGLGWAETR
jgi:hypothetical protein